RSLRSTLFPYTTLFRSLVRVPHQADKNKGEEQGREKIKGAVLVTGDAIIGAPLLVGQFQIDLAVAGDVADVAVLENLQPGTQSEDRKSTRLNSSHVSTS